MKILIFGVSGNCGKYCAKRFIEDGHTVVGVSRTVLKEEIVDLKTVKGDITDKSFFSNLPTDFDLVVNFAGVQPSILLTSENTDLETTLHSYVDVNMVGTFNVLEFVRTSRISTYIYATTHRDIERSWKQGSFLKNDEPININYQGDHSMYAISKTTGKMMGDYYGQAFGIRVFNLRLPMMFLVPDEPYYLKDGKPTLMPFLQLIKKAMGNHELEIWGNKELKRDYVHVENLYSLIQLTSKSDLLEGTFNVGTGEAATTERFVKSIGEEFNPDPFFNKYVYKPDAVTYKCAIYDVDQQKKVLGYKPILLSEMLKRLHNEIKEGDYLTKWNWL